MGLAETQRLLARLYTEVPFRERFFADPDQVGEELGLTPEQARRLAELSGSRVRFFADSLRLKRSRSVRKLLPLTTQALGDHFTELFEAYAADAIPRGHGKPRADALAFAAFLQRAGRAGPAAVPSVRALAHYEAARLKATDPARRFTLCLLPAPVEQLTRHAHDHGLALAQPARPTVVLWLRPAPRSRLRRVVFSLPRLRFG